MSDNWQAIAIVSGLLAAWGATIIAVIRWMFSKNESVIYEKLSSIDMLVEDGRDLEKKFLELKADLPLNYVRKEDFIRHEVVINTKLDRLRDMMEKCIQTGGIAK